MNPHCVKLTHGPRWRYIIQIEMFITATIYVLNQCHSLEVIVGLHFLRFDTHLFYTVYHTNVAIFSILYLLCIVTFSAVHL